MSIELRPAVLIAFLALLGLPTAPPLGAAAVPIWSDVAPGELVAAGQRDIIPARYRTVALDRAALDAVLLQAPLEGSANALVVDVTLELPLPEGGFGRFRVVESPIMAPELARKFPEIQTFLGQGLDDPTSVTRFDRTPNGFHAMVLSTSGTVYIDPYSRGDREHYIVYDTRDAVNPSASDFRCEVHADASANRLVELTTGAPNLPNGTTLKTYRLAVAATGEYTAFHGGTVPTAMAEIVTAMNRVNGIYERDLAIRMELIANNDLVVYTDGGTDPYTNNSGGTMLGQNTTNLNTVIGSANYDIGHVFSTGGGGVATLNGPCGANKARGVTGLSSPIGDPFYVDYVAHEMGHQWGGNHSFNGNSGFCSGSINPATAYEPGSGTTIMGYAGICDPQNVQQNSDDYFHAINYQEIVNFVTAGNGNSCDVPTATGNTPPVPEAGLAYTIPINTPFELCGTATDVDSDTLSYSWEEFDLGAAGDPNSPVGSAPIFRSFEPTVSRCRTFPRRSDLLNNTQTLGEILPSYARTMNFRMTVRDNQAGGGGADYDSTSVVVSAAGGPFLVTAPNTAVSWTAGSNQNVTWNVAGTDVAPIACVAVDIALSLDGGQTFVITLATGTPNDGSASVVVPNAGTTQARVRVRCAGNIFFDVSNTNFTVVGDPPIFIDSFESGDTSAWTATVP